MYLTSFSSPKKKSRPCEAGLNGYKKSNLYLLFTREECKYFKLNERTGYAFRN